MKPTFYVKAQSPDGCTTTLVGIEEDNVFTRCPDCGEEICVDLADIASVWGELDLYGHLLVKCARCSGKPNTEEAPHQTLRDEEDVLEEDTPDELGIVPGRQPTYGQMLTTLTYYVDERGVNVNRALRELGDYTRLSQVPAERYWELLYVCEVLAE